MSTIVIVYSVFGSPEEADRIARAMVEERLAACANVLSPARSVYRWNGAIETATETPVLFKTAAAHAEGLKAAIASRHSYDLPAVLSWPAGSTPAYARWIEDETGEAAS